MPGHSSFSELTLKLSYFLPSRSSQFIVPSLSFPICEMETHSCIYPRVHHIAELRVAKKTNEGPLGRRRHTRKG